MASVAFLRPRMGIGGSERLITDAAVALKQRGHAVTLFVPDTEDVPQFPELAHYGIPFETAGAFIPSEIGGRLRAPLAVARTGFSGWRLARAVPRPDVIISDVVPHVLPLVRRWSRLPVLYYCHFPDFLLTRDGTRESWVYRAYRRPLDRIEERGVCAADVVATNSLFTSGIVREAFPRLNPAQMRVIYPGVPVPVTPQRPAEDETLLVLSVSRFDPRKNLGLAVSMLSALRGLVPAAVFARVELVLAGHVDRRLPECVSLVQELENDARRCGVADQVRFEFSPSEAARNALLARARCLVYTPTAEHFGYVPIEAMAAGRPVVAVNNGGPTETVVDGETGYLCEPSPGAFAAAVAAILSDPEGAGRMGMAGHARVGKKFSLGAFGDGLDEVVTRLAARAASMRAE